MVGMDEEGQKGKVAWCCERDTESTSMQFCIGSSLQLEASGVFYTGGQNFLKEKGKELGELARRLHISVKPA